MTILTRQIENKNLLSSLWFNFLIKKAPHFSYFVQTVEVPSLDAGVAQINNPFKIQSFTGDHMTFGDINATFKIDEDMYAYTEMYDWIIGTTFPNNFNEYKNLADKEKTTGEGLYADATLTILSSTKRPSLEFRFYNLFPIALSGFPMSSTAPDAEYIDCSVTFRFSHFSVNRL